DGWLGARATAPIAREPPVVPGVAVSRSDVQVVPPSRVRYSPPWAVPTYAVFGLVGCTAIAVTRPLTAVTTPSVWPLGMGVGPIAGQLVVLIRGAPGAVAARWARAIWSSARFRRLGSNGLPGWMPRRRPMASDRARRYAPLSTRPCRKPGT